MPLIGNAPISPSNSQHSSMKRVKTDLPFKKGKNKSKKMKKAARNFLDKKHREHLKRKKVEESDDEDEPAGVQGGLSAKRGLITSKSSKNTVAEMPSLYKKDLGKRGVKKKLHSTLPSISKFSVPLTDDEEQRRLERQMRFVNTTASNSSASAEIAVFTALSATRASSVNSKTLGNNKYVRKKRKLDKIDQKVDEEESATFIGNCQNLEKPYLRLTSFPKAEDVRPIDILKLAFEHVKIKYAETEDFDWANEQMKSIRQDLTVQGIRNDFALSVYETHARLALECGQLNEFNQCQTMIKTLTLGVGIANSTKTDIGLDAIPPNPTSVVEKKNCKLLHHAEDSADEFAAYRLLYALVQKEWGDVTKELANTSALMTEEQKHKTYRCEGVSSCRHAVLVTKAVVHSDYHIFFILYENAPNMSAYLMDFLVQRVRKNAYERIVSAYRPTLSVEFFREALSFHDLEETRTFLKQNGAKFVQEGHSEPPFWIDCKASR